MGIKTKSREICFDYGEQTIFREFVTIITVQIKIHRDSIRARKAGGIATFHAIATFQANEKKSPELMPLFPLSFRRPSTHLDQLDIQVPNWGTFVQSINIQCSVYLVEGEDHFQCQQCHKRPSCNDCTFRLMRLRNSCPLCRFQK
jgi:hypothetical protein